jgi:hypothetical protein
MEAIIDLDEEILSRHLIGPKASNLVREDIVAITAGADTIQDIRKSVLLPRTFGGRLPRLLRAVQPWWRRTRTPIGARKPPPPDEERPFVYKCFWRA